MQGGAGAPDVDRLAVIREALHAIADGVALAALLTAQAKYEEAEPLLRQAVTAFDAALGHASNEMAVSAGQLASLLNATDRSEEAVELYRRVLRIRQEQFGSDHPTVVSTLHNLALACHAAGRADEAQILWDEARAALETTKQATP